MGRIGSTLSGFQLRLLNLHAEATAAANLNSLRLASGSNILSPGDDVSGFVDLSGFESELAAVRQASTNVSNASALVSGAQLLLDQVRTQLDTIRSRAVEDEDQGLTADERAANQAAIDEAIAEIDRLVSTEVNGRRLLDGSADFRYAGLDGDEVRELRVLSLGSADSQTISGSVTSAATQATLAYTGLAGTVNSGDATLTLTGSRGSTTLSATDGEDLTDVRDRVNADSHRTGVTAEVAGNVLTFRSVGYGSDETIEISATSGTFTVAGTGEGIDATATINGRSITGDGNRFSVHDNGFRFTIEFAAGFSGAFNTVTASGTALTFALTTELSQTSSLAIPGLQASRLGGPSGMLDQLLSGGDYAGLGDNSATAIRIVDEALADLTRIEGAVDGFANGVIESAAALADGFESELEDAIDAINLVDEERESLLQTRNEALATNALAALANLDAHQQRLLDLVRQIAGFTPTI
jgi:flagellin-like hook-associated protein FlgL